QTDGATQQEPPQRRADEDSGNQARRPPIVTRGASQSQCGENGCERQNRHGIGESEKERGQIGAGDAAGLGRGDLAVRLGEECSDPEGTEEEAADEPKSELLPDQEVRDGRQPEPGDRAVKSVRGGGAQAGGQSAATT